MILSIEPAESGSRHTARRRVLMSIKTDRELKGLTRAGRVVALTLRAMQDATRPGASTAELDDVAAKVFQQHGARSAPQLLYNFPGVTCISVNDEVVHGIPGARVLHKGDVVKLDVTAELDGYIADAAVTVALPDANPTLVKMCRCAEAAFRKSLEVARAGHRVYDIGKVVEAEVVKRGCSVIPGLNGHGVGRAIHEDPTVPNYFDRRANSILTDGLVITIEPIITAGQTKIITSSDGWTVRTTDGSYTAHYEHTVVIRRGRPLLITAAEAA